MTIESMVFDGIMLSLPSRLPVDRTHFYVDNPNQGGPRILVTLILRKHTKANDYEIGMFYNRVFRKVLSRLELVEFRRNYFDPAGKRMVRDSLVISLGRSCSPRFVRFFIRIAYLEMFASARRDL